MAETAGQIDIFDVLADVAADEQNLHIDRHGIPTLFASPTRGVAARIAEFRDLGDHLGAARLDRRLPRVPAWNLRPHRSHRHLPTHLRCSGPRLPVPGHEQGRSM
ncbi:hypothetical protein CH286_25150 [Rhodococcus sp. WWJCD1]|nr:hypothetical protein CH286_25150 [Rhodococcus sp. WWJCD1]OZE89314.1 hypothetical protein CH302_28455 [Rhodococcus sp. 15-2388-1-1a]